MAIHSYISLYERLTLFFYTGVTVEMGVGETFGQTFGHLRRPRVFHMKKSGALGQPWAKLRRTRFFACLPFRCLRRTLGVSFGGLRRGHSFTSMTENVYVLIFASAELVGVYFPVFWGGGSGRNKGFNENCIK